MASDYYKILGVDKNASAAEIKKAYRKLSKQHHPDAGGSDEEEFKKISEAYSTLSDPEKKNRYDNQGSGFNFGGFGGFEDFFRGFNNQQPQPNRGRNLHLTYSISLDDVMTGGRKAIRYNRKVKCVSCNGQGGADLQHCTQCGGAGKIKQVQRTAFGVIEQINTCFACNGKGTNPKNICTSCKGAQVVDQPQTVEVDLQIGITNGTTYKFSHAGDENNNGITGDLILEIRYAPHPQFQVHNHDLICTLKLPFTLMILGGKIELKSLNDITHHVNIPPMTKPEQVLRLQGLGLPFKDRKGDILIKIQIEFPSTINDSDKALIEKLAESDNFIYNKK